MFKRYARYWRDSFDFTSGAYRLDYWWITVINLFIFASLLSVSVLLFHSWALAGKLASGFGALVFIPSLSLLVRRLRDTGLASYQIQFFLISPTFFWTFAGLMMMLKLTALVPLALAIYVIVGIVFVSQRSAYWTPKLDSKQKITYTAGFTLLIVASCILYVISFAQIFGGVHQTIHKMTQAQKNQDARVRQAASQRAASENSAFRVAIYGSETSSSSTSSGTSSYIAPPKSASSIPEKVVTKVPDDAFTKAYRTLSETTIGDTDFGWFTVHGVWQQDSNSLQWHQIAQDVMILTSTQGQGWGVDATSFPFHKIVGRSTLTLQQNKSQVSRIEGTYQEAGTEKIKEMAYLEWRTTDGHLRTVYVIAPSEALVNFIVTMLVKTYQPNG